MSYEEMSDFEINQAVTREVHQCHDWAKNKDGSFYHCGVLGESYIHQEVIDYCNNPSDAWPIIFRNDIMLNPNCADSLWKAEQGFRFKPRGFYIVATAYSKNPLRAAMIAFLMMKGAECQKP